jgi:hypothetical protein
MLTKSKMALVATLLIGSASVAVAQYDGDANLVPGSLQWGTIVEAPSAFANTFAATRPTVQVQRRQLDADGNPIPGSR